MPKPLAYKARPSPHHATAWLVEAIDEQGFRWVLFQGDYCERAAKEYAAWKNGEANREAMEKTRLDNLDRAFKASARDRELASALTRYSLIPGAASQLITLLRPHCDMRYEGGRVVVKLCDTSVEEALRVMFTWDKYKHFLRPGAMT